jgi:hypothetical protein
VTDDPTREHVWTVARVRAAGDDVEVMFYERARLFRLPHSAAAFDDTLRVLLAAADSGAAVRVRLTEPHGEVIERATTPHASDE